MFQTYVSENSVCSLGAAEGCWPAGLWTGMSVAGAALGSSFYVVIVKDI